MTTTTGQPLLFPMPPEDGPPRETLVVDGDVATAISPEGVRATMPVADLLARAVPAGLDCGSVVIPDGVRSMRTGGGVTVVVWEIEPRVHHVRWIAKDSPVPFAGAPDPTAKAPGTVKYEDRRLAMPYLLVFAVFGRRRGRLTLTGRNEAYFRTDPYRSGADELCYPALLNISRYPDGAVDGNALAWICTQYTNLARLAIMPDENERVRASLKALLHTLLGTGFNRSSEHHELESYYTYCARTMPEIADLDEWEARSREDPLWVLDAAWPKATLGGRPLTVDRLLERIVRLAGGGATTPRTAAALARIVFNQAGRRAGNPPGNAPDAPKEELPV